MKRFWARYLTAAAFGCLLILWTLPASAYYPPLQAWVVVEPLKVGVTYKVDDPKRGHVEYSAKYWENTVVDCKQDNGVMAWIFYNPGGYYFVITCVYDPDQGGFIEDAQGSFASVPSQLTVKDGVVAYVVPSKNYPGHQAAIYATYDPLRGWMKSSYEAWYNSSNISLLTKDGLVVFTSQWDADPSQTHILFDIYDPKLGQWAEGFVGPYDHSFTQPGVHSLHIDNATLYFTTTVTDIFGQTTSIDWVAGYRPDYQMPFLNPWSYSYPTRPMAYFVAQPKIGTKPMWVWFTDMSIGATTWNWNFDDNKPPSTNRSPYHTFDSSGTFWVSQQVTGPNGSNTYTDPIIVAYPTVLKKRIPGVLYLLLLAD